MSEIKELLKEIVETTLIPQVEEYLEELNKELSENKENEDTLEAIRDMESFLVELENIILAIDEDKMDDEQAQEIYGKIIKLIEENQEEE